MNQDLHSASAETDAPITGALAHSIAPPSDSSLPTNTAAHTLRWSGMTDRGRVRPNNEDAFLALTFDAREVRYLGKIGEASLSDADFIFAVSDGMGGAKSGEFASRIAVDKITHLMPRSFKSRVSGFDSGFQDVLTEVFLGIHAELIKLAESYEECAGMGATLSLAWFTPERMMFGHIGDSRIYHLPAEGGLKQITHDHTQVGWMFRNGKLNERELRTHPNRHSLQRALGAGNQFVEPHVGVVTLQPGDRILLCTDGLTDGLWDHQIEKLLTTALEAKCLVEAAIEASGRDNTTAILVEVGKDEIKNW